MKRMCLAALSGALTISALAVAVDVASAAPRHGVARGTVNRGGVNGVNRVGMNRVGVNGVNRVGAGRVGVGYGGYGYGRGALANRGGWNGYYRPGIGLAAGAAIATTAAYGSGYYGGGYYGGGGGYYGGDDYYASAGSNGGYYGNAGYEAYASTADDTGAGGDAYILHGNYISETDAVAYCAQRFRSYDVASQTFLANSGERVSCPQQ